MALVLSRRLRERIQIGEDIIVEVAAIRGKEVKLAIFAPAMIVVKRVGPKDVLKVPALPSEPGPEGSP